MVLSRRIKIIIVGCWALGAWLLIAAFWAFFAREQQATGWLLLGAAFGAEALGGITVLVGLRRPPS